MRSLPLPLALALACAACTQAPPTDPAKRATLPTPQVADAPATEPADASTDSAGSRPEATQAPPTRGFVPLPPGSPTPYTCDDGSGVEVAYGRDQATVTLADGRAVTLPKAQSASKGGGDVYVGDAVSLMHAGGRIELHVDESAARTCLQHQT